MAKISDEINCCHVEPAIEARKNEQLGTNHRAPLPGPFLLAYQFIHWGLKCLNEKLNEEDNFPEDQEKILFDAIRENTGKLKPDLIRYETVALKRFRAILQDYKAGDDAAYNSVLMAGLQGIYDGILNKKKKANLSDQKWMWERQIDQVRDALVPTEPKLNTNVEDFLQLQVDVSSLLIIKSQIEEFLTAKDHLSANEYVLALQRVFQVAGEFVKKSQMSPNLSEKTRQSLKEKYIPVDLLIEYRDILAHLQSVDPNEAFRSDEFERNKGLLEEAWRGLGVILKNEVRDLEEGFFVQVVKEKIVGSEQQKQLNELLESCKTNIIACFEKEIKSKNTDNNLCPAEIERELVQYAKHMKSVEYPDVGTEIVPDTSVIGDAIINAIVKSKRGQYDSLEAELKKTWCPDPVGRLMADHDFQIELMAVEYIAKYGSPSARSELIDMVKRLKISIPDVTEDAMGKWVSDRKPWLTKEGRLAEAKELLGGKEGAQGIIDMLSRLERRREDFNPREYKQAVDNLKSLSEDEKDPLTYISVEWAMDKYFQYHKTELIPFYNKLLGSEVIIKPKTRNEALKQLADEVRHVTEELHTKRLKQAIQGLIPLTNPSAVESEVLNIMAVRGLMMGKHGRDNSNESRGGHSNESGGRSEPEIDDDEFKQFRNFLAHSDDLTSREQNEEIATSLVEMKDQIKGKLTGLKNKEKVSLEEVGDIMNELYQPAMEIKKILCPGSTAGESGEKRKWEWGDDRGKGRKARETESCLTARDVEDVLDDDGNEINGEKLLRALSREIHDDEGKFDNYISFASQSDITGESKDVTEFVVRHQETFNKHWETVEAFSGKVTHGFMVKNIIGELLRGDIKGVTVDTSFLAGGYGLEVISTKMATRGEYLVEEGSIMLGRSLKMAAPFLSKGMTVFVAYDLYDQVKALKNCQTKECKEDAIVGIVGDSVQVGVDTAEVIGPTIVNVVTGTLQLASDAAGLGIDIAGAAALESISAVLGPVGMALSAAVFVGTDIYQAVKEVKEIDKELHLTGWEKFETGVKAFLGLNAGLENDIENKHWNTDAVEQAMAKLKSTPNIKRYVFPSYVQVVNCTKMERSDSDYDYGHIIELPICCTEIMSAIHSTVRLTQKVNGIKWSRVSPDDVSDADIFCKPIADPAVESGRQAPDSYYCENAIGVEYNQQRTDDYALINMGIGNSYVEGFPESGNIFVINRRNKTLIGGNKDDSFIFNRDPTANRVTKMKTYCDSYALQKLEPMDVSQELFGVIDGKGGTNTIDVNGLKWQTDTDMAQMVVNFIKNTLNYQTLDAQKPQASFSIKNINKYLGIVNYPDLVTASCETTYINGRAGYNDDYPDIITIPGVDCSYNTTIIINSFTTVKNEANAGTFRYLVQGDIGEMTRISLKKNTRAKHTFEVPYALDAVAAITKSSDATTFSFVDDYYDKSVSLENAVNMTITRGHYSITFLLKDSARIVVGDYNTYALINTDRDIDDDLIEEYTDISKNLNMYLVVNSDQQVLTIAGRRNDVLTNDPKSAVSHFVSGAGDNIFSLVSGRDKYTEDFHINDVVIHFYDTVSFDRIDLRRIAAQVTNGQGRKMTTVLKSVKDDLILSLLHPQEQFMKITLKNVVKYKWYSKIQIVADVTFSIEERNGTFNLAPLPLIFDDPSVNLIIIHPRDVTEGMNIRIFKKLNGYILARKEDALIITSSTYHIFESSITVVLNGFYADDGISDKMRSLVVRFEDKSVRFDDMQQLMQLHGDSYEETKKLIRRSLFKSLVRAAEINQRLFQAIDSGRIKDAKAIVRDNRDYVNDKDEWGVPLLRAIQMQNATAVNLILFEGRANVTIVGTDGRSPLYYAVKYREQEMIDSFMRRLFDGREDPNAVMAAITSGLPIVKYVTSWKNTNEHAWKRFIGYKEDTKATLLHHAMVYGNIDVVKYLITEGGEDGNITAQNRYGKTPLYYAVKYKHSAVINHLDTVIRMRGVIPLSLSVVMGDLSTVMYLIEEKGVDIYEKDMSGKTPLFYAIQQDSDDMIHYLIRTIREDGDGQVLIYPVITGDMTVLEYLIKRRTAPINAENFLGKTALHYAALTGNLQMVEALCNYGADVDVEDRSGRTPWDSGIQGQSAEVVDYLSKKLGVDPVIAAAKAGKLWLLDKLTKGDKKSLRRTYDSGNSLLHMAVGWQNVDLVKYLVENGIDPKVWNSDGDTPLHYVAMRHTIKGQTQGLKLPNSLKIGKILIEKGAKINARDNSQMTPVDKLVTNLDDNYLALLKLFVENGADVSAGLDTAERKDRNSAFSTYLRGKMRGLSERKRRQIDNEKRPAPKATFSPQTTTNTNVTSSVTNYGFLNWAKTSFNRLLNYQPNNNQSPDVPISYDVDANSTIMLIDLLVRKVTGQKYVGTPEGESPSDVQARALNIAWIFEETLNSVASEFDVNYEDDFDPVTLQSVIIRQLRAGQSSEIPKTLYTFAKQACSKSGQCEKFLERVGIRLSEDARET